MPSTWNPRTRNMNSIVLNQLHATGAQNHMNSSMYWTGKRGYGAHAVEAAEEYTKENLDIARAQKARAAATTAGRAMKGSDDGIKKEEEDNIPKAPSAYESIHGAKKPDPKPKKAHTPRPQSRDVNKAELRTVEDDDLFEDEQQIPQTTEPSLAPPRRRQRPRKPQYDPLRPMQHPGRKKPVAPLPRAISTPERRVVYAAQDTSEKMVRSRAASGPAISQVQKKPNPATHGSSETVTAPARAVASAARPVLITHQAARPATTGTKASTAVTSGPESRPASHTVQERTSPSSSRSRPLGARVERSVGGKKSSPSSLATSSRLEKKPSVAARSDRTGAGVKKSTAAPRDLSGVTKKALEAAMGHKKTPESKVKVTSSTNAALARDKANTTTLTNTTPSGSRKRAAPFAGDNPQRKQKLSTPARDTSLAYNDDSENNEPIMVRRKRSGVGRVDKKEPQTTRLDSTRAGVKKSVSKARQEPAVNKRAIEKAFDASRTPATKKKAAEPAKSVEPAKRVKSAVLAVLQDDDVPDWAKELTREHHHYG